VERAAEKGSAIAATVEGIERQFGNTPSTFIEILLEQISTIIMESGMVAIVSPKESVYIAAKKMRGFSHHAYTGNFDSGIRL
jgi:hypothetical protein